MHTFKVDPSLKFGFSQRDRVAAIAMKSRDSVNQRKGVCGSMHTFKVDPSLLKFRFSRDQPAIAIKSRDSVG